MIDPKDPLNDLEVVGVDYSGKWVFDKPKVAADSTSESRNHTYSLKIPNTQRLDEAFWYCPRCASIWSQPGRCQLDTLPEPITGTHRPNPKHQPGEPRPRLNKLSPAASMAAYAVGGRQAVQAMAEVIVFGPRAPGHDHDGGSNNGNP